MVPVSVGKLGMKTLFLLTAICCIDILERTHGASTVKPGTGTTAKPRTGPTVRPGTGRTVRPFTRKGTTKKPTTTTKAAKISAVFSCYECEWKLALPDVNKACKKDNYAGTVETKCTQCQKKVKTKGSEIIEVERECKSKAKKKTNGCKDEVKDGIKIRSCYCSTSRCNDAIRLERLSGWSFLLVTLGVAYNY